MIRLERCTRYDQQGFRVRLRGFVVFSATRWHWNQRGTRGWLVTFTPINVRVARTSAAWGRFPSWKRWLWPGEHLTRTFYLGWRARGGRGKGWPHGPWRTLRAGWSHWVPYSFGPSA